MTLVVLEIPPQLSTAQRPRADFNFLAKSQGFEVVDVVPDDPDRPGDLEAQVQTQRGREEFARALTRRPYFRTYRSYLVLSARSTFTVNYPVGG